MRFRKYYDILTKEFLEENYIKQLKSCRKIQEETGISKNIVSKYLKEYGIPLYFRNNKNRPKITLTKEELYEFYINQKMYIKDIAKKFNCSQMIIKRRLFKFGLKEKMPVNEFKNIVNQTFNKLTVIEYSHRNNKRHYWFCQCECGTKLIVTTNHLISGHTKSCGCINLNSPSRKSEYVGELSKTFFNCIKRSGDIRDIEFSLTKEFLWSLFQKQEGKCALSGVKITMPYHSKDLMGGIVKTASVDRIDSDKPYTEDNVQWVHKDINKMKSNFGQKYFKEMCEFVANYKELEDNKLEDSTYLSYNGI